MKKWRPIYGLVILLVTSFAWGQVITNPSSISLSYLDTDAALTDNSDAKIASQKAVKSYVDTGLSTKAPIPVTITIASSATPTPAVGTVGATIYYDITALTEAAAFGAPTGTPVNFQSLLVRIKDDGTARALTWNVAYDEGDDLALPTTTVLGKLMYCAFHYDSTSSKWHYTGQIGGF